jgi:CheY-like chemotaxis protein/HPt (histidine-containing phosphotransfer) domain-containing protein
MSDRRKPTDLDERLAALRRSTEAGFGERARELRRAAEALDGGEADARETIRRLAHQLRGVAGSAGHAALGDRAGRLEQAARGPASALAIVEGARRLAAAAEHARRGDATRAEPARRAPASAPAPPRLGWRVVALDDEPSTRRLLSITLEQAAGCEAHVVGDPATAMAMVKERTPDLVIVDAMMPEIDGLTFYRGVRRAAGAELPVVILSAATPDELGWQLPDDPRLRWMRKPFRPGTLLEALHEVVGEPGGAGQWT